MVNKQSNDKNMVFFSASDIAKLVGYSASQIRRLICQGVIKAYRVGNFYAVDKNELDSIKKRLKKKQPKE